MLQVLALAINGVKDTYKKPPIIKEIYNLELNRTENTMSSCGFLYN